MRCWSGYLSEAGCKWSAYGPADATATSSSLASLKSRLVYPFWCLLTEVLEKRPLNGCLCLSIVMKADTCLDGAILRHDCLAEMHEVRKSLVQDFSINPLLVRDCSYEIEKHCGGRVQRAGRTIHCLMELARSVKTEDDTAAISPRCVRTVRHVVVICANRVIGWSHLILLVNCCRRIQANLYLSSSFENIHCACYTMNTGALQ